MSRPVSEAMVRLLLFLQEKKEEERLLILPSKITKGSFFESDVYTLEHQFLRTLSIFCKLSGILFNSLKNKKNGFKNGFTLFRSDVSIALVKCLAILLEDRTWKELDTEMETSCNFLRNM